MGNNRRIVRVRPVANLRLRCALCVCAVAFFPTCAPLTTGVSSPTAGVSGLSADVEPKALVARCPTFIRTTGIISGNPGSEVTYKFIGNGLPWSPARRGIISPSGALRVTEVSRIDAAHAGYWFRQIWVIVNGGALDKFSNRAKYTVVCGAPTAVSGLTADVEPKAHIARCPTFIRTTGIISGNRGSPVAYKFIGNGLPWSSLRRGIIPPSGALRVTELSRIDAAHAGYSFRQIWVIVNGGALDKFSNSANYSVVCAEPPFLLDITPPINLALTFDPGVCADHVEPRSAGTLCGAALATGYAEFVWDWKSDGCPSEPCKSIIDGYRVYQLVSKSRRLVAVTTDPTMTVAVLASRAAALTGNCYAVYAFRGLDESSASNEVCVRPGYAETLERIALKPATLVRPPGGGAVVKFGLQSLSGLAIWRATLNFAAKYAAASGNSREPCIQAVGLPSADLNPLSEGTVRVTAYAKDAGSTPIDVTSAVRAWVQGTLPNYGFFLQMASSGDPRNEQICRTFRGVPVLTVDYLNL